jgi:hypothetical protein
MKRKYKIAKTIVALANSNNYRKVKKTAKENCKKDKIHLHFFKLLIG